MKQRIPNFDNFELSENPGGLNIPDKAYNELKNLVEELLHEYKGGRAFFDALDDRIKDVTNKDMILDLVRPYKDDYIISSGGFGETVLTLYDKGFFKCKGVVIVNGKMETLKKDVEFYKPESFDLNDKQFIFVDDSHFSGGTVNKTNEFLKKYNSSIKQVAVIYDGSKNKTKFVKSFFRYYK